MPSPTKSQLPFALFALAFLLIYLPTGLAASVDFRAQIVGESICCAQGDLQLNLTNHAGSAKEFLIMYQGLPIRQMVGANASQMVILQVLAACGQSNHYDLSVSVGADTILVQRDLVGVRCAAVQLAINNQTQACPNTVVEFPFQVINPSNLPQPYHLSVASKQRFITFSENDFVLAPGQIKEVIAFLQMPDSAQAYDLISFTATARNAGQFITVPVRIDYDGCYAYDLAVPTEPVVACIGKDTGVPLQLSSAYPVGLTFGADRDWAKVYPYGMSARNTTINLTLSPEHAFERDVVISATSAAKTIKRTVQVKAVNCDDLLIETPTESFDAIDCQQSTIPILLKNRAITPLNVSLTLAGPEWASLDFQEQITLDPDEEQSINLVMNPCNASGKHTITLSSGSVSKKITVQVADQSSLSASIRVPDTKISAGDNTVAFVVKNTGAQAAAFTVSVEGGTAVFAPTPVQLQAGEDQEFTFSLTAEEGAEEQILIKVMHDNAEVASKEVTLSTRKLSAATVLMITAFILLLVIAVIVIMVVLEMRKRNDREPIEPMQATSLQQKLELAQARRAAESKEAFKRHAPEASKRPDAAAWRLQTAGQPSSDDQPKAKGGASFVTYAAIGFLVILIVAGLAIPLIKLIAPTSNQTNSAQENSTGAQPPVAETPSVPSPAAGENAAGTATDDTKAPSSLAAFWNDYKYFMIAGILGVVALIIAIEIIKALRTK